MELDVVIGGKRLYVFNVGNEPRLFVWIFPESDDEGEDIWQEHHTESVSDAVIESLGELFGGQAMDCETDDGTHSGDDAHDDGEGLFAHIEVKGADANGEDIGESNEEGQQEHPTVSPGDFVVNEITVEGDDGSPAMFSCPAEDSP